jgi:hypothetical protein
MLCISFGPNPTLYDLDLWEKRCHIMRGVGGVFFFLFFFFSVSVFFLLLVLVFARFICIVR